MQDLLHIFIDTGNNDPPIFEISKQNAVEDLEQNLSCAKYFEVSTKFVRKCYLRLRQNVKCKSE